MIAYIRVSFCILVISGLIFVPAGQPRPAALAAARASQAPAKAPADDAVPPDVPGALFPGVVARVDGNAVLGRDLVQRIQNQLAPMGNPEWKNLREEYRQELINQSLSSLIATELIYRKALASGTKASEKEIQAEFDRALQSFGGDAQMNIGLANRGMDREDFRKELLRTLTVTKYIDTTITKKISITPEELMQYYTGHPEEFRHPGMVKTSNILLQIPEGSTPEQESLIRKRAEELLARAKKGEDFAKLAKEYSMDPSASNGGDIGMVAKGRLMEEYENAAFALPLGGISDVVRTGAGFYIIKLAEKREAGIAKFEDIQDQLKEFLQSQQNDEGVEKLVNELRGAAKVEVSIPLAAPLTFGNITISSPRP